MSLKSRLYRLSDATHAVPLSATSTWRPFWTLPTSAEDMVTALPTSDIRYLRGSNVTNFTNLIRAASVRLLQLSAAAPADTSSVSASLSSAPSAHASSAPSTHSSSAPSSASRTQLLNCVRLLTRLLPFLFESPELADTEQRIFWGDDALGKRLVLAAVQLLFTAGFTTPAADTRGAVAQADLTLWEAGIGAEADAPPAHTSPRASPHASSHASTHAPSPAYQPPNIDLDCNRLEIIRLLICLCSQPLYTRIATVVSAGSAYLAVLVTETPKLRLLALLSSLLNVVCRSTLADPDRNGLTFEMVAFKEQRVAFISAAVHLLVMMLVYPAECGAGARAGSTSARANSNSARANSSPGNLARAYTGRIYKPAEIDLLLSGIVSPILRPVCQDPNDSALTNWVKTKWSQSDVSGWMPELLMLFWELYQCNRRFRASVARRYGAQLLVALLYHVYQYRGMRARRSSVRISLYLSLYLLSDRSIRHALLSTVSRTFYDGLPPAFKLAVNPTTYRDLLLYQTCALLLADCPAQYRPILVELVYNYIPLTVLAIDPSRAPTENRRFCQRELAAGKISPLEISYVAASKVLQLVAKLADPGGLVSEPARSDLLALVIRALAHAVCRVPDHTVVLQYVMMKSRAALVRVGAVIDDVSARLAAGEERAQDDPASSDTSASATPVPVPSPSADNTTPAMEFRPPFGSRRPSTVSVASKVSSAVSGRSNSVYSTDELIETLTMAESQIEHEQMLQQGIGELDTKPDTKTPESRDPLDEDVVRPRMPVGMSERAKSKQRLCAPLKDTWPGRQALGILLKVTAHLQEQLATQPDTNSTADSLNSINSLHLDRYIKELHVCDEYNPERTQFEPLRFRWSKLSLGWYEAVLWGCIYTGHVTKRSKKIMDELSSSFTAIKRVSAGWWWGKPDKSQVEDQQHEDLMRKMSGLSLDEDGLRKLVADSTTHAGIWNGTRVKLFRVSSSSSSSGSSGSMRSRQKSDPRLTQ